MALKTTFNSWQTNSTCTIALINLNSIMEAEIGAHKRGARAVRDGAARVRVGLGLLLVAPLALLAALNGLLAAAAVAGQREAGEIVEHELVPRQTTVGRSLLTAARIDADTLNLPRDVYSFDCVRTMSLPRRQDCTSTGTCPPTYYLVSTDPNPASNFTLTPNTFAQTGVLFYMAKADCSISAVKLGFTAAGNAPFNLSLLASNWLGPLATALASDVLDAPAQAGKSEYLALPGIASVQLKAGTYYTLALGGLKGAGTSFKVTYTGSRTLDTRTLSIAGIATQRLAGGTWSRVMGFPILDLAFTCIKRTTTTRTTKTTETRTASTTATMGIATTTIVRDAYGGFTTAKLAVSMSRLDVSFSYLPSFFQIEYLDACGNWTAVPGASVTVDPAAVFRSWSFNTLPAVVETGLRVTFGKPTIGRWVDPVVRPVGVPVWKPIVYEDVCPLVGRTTTTSVTRSTSASRTRTASRTKTTNTKTTTQIRTLESDLGGWMQIQKVNLTFDVPQNSPIIISYQDRCGFWRIPGGGAITYPWGKKSFLIPLSIAVLGNKLQVRYTEGGIPANPVISAIGSSVAAPSTTGCMSATSSVTLTTATPALVTPEFDLGVSWANVSGVVVSFGIPRANFRVEYKDGCGNWVLLPGADYENTVSPRLLWDFRLAAGVEASKVRVVATLPAWEAAYYRPAVKVMGSEIGAPVCPSA